MDCICTAIARCTSPQQSTAEFLLCFWTITGEREMSRMSTCLPRQTAPRKTRGARRHSHASVLLNTSAQFCEFSTRFHDAQSSQVSRSPSAGPVLCPANPDDNCKEYQISARESHARSAATRRSFHRCNNNNSKWCPSTAHAHCRHHKQRIAIRWFANFSQSATSLPRLRPAMRESNPPRISAMRDSVECPAHVGLVRLNLLATSTCSCLSFPDGLFPARQETSHVTTASHSWLARDEVE